MIRPFLAIPLAGALLACPEGLEGQHPVERTDIVVRTLRAADQPVIPAFEGWYQTPDGRYELCFGYFTANTEQALDIPLGSDNFIQPSRFDGGQPTHFDPLPPAHRRYFCVFTVNVPESYGEGSEEVVWTLRVGDQEYSARGYPRVRGYELNEPVAPERAAVWPDLIERAGPDEDLTALSPGLAQGSEAPVLRFVDPPGPEGRGRTGMTAEPVRTKVGESIPLAVRVLPPEGRPARWWVGWFQHQGPQEGKIRFTEQELTADASTDYRASTTATFTAPGEYLLRVQSIENVNSFERHCCWTNGYVRVRVDP